VSLRPGEETRRELSQWINQLGDVSFAKREEAMLKLRQRSAVAIDTLQAAATHKDPEIRWRAKKLLENASGEGHATFFAAFKTIEARKLKGFVDPILLTLPLVSKEHVRFAARQAMAATATASDIPRLRAELKNTDPQLRIAALQAIAAVNEKESAGDAMQLSKDANDHVRMSAARILSRLGRREVLDVLVSLLDAPEIELRGEAGRTLKIITGQDFSYVAYDREELRNAARDKWRAWLAASGQTAKLTALVKDAPFELNRLLICSYGTSTIYEFDADAKDASSPRWQIQVGQQPWGVQGLPSGNRLVVHYTERRILEFGPEATAKEPIWKSDQLPGGPMGAQRLENGNTVVACSDSDQVVELSGEGKIIQSWKVAGRPVDVQRLENGNTLVCLQNAGRVVEIDQDGKEVWSVPAGPTPFSAQRLENGNTLVAIYSGRRVVEYSPDKREVWQLTDLVNPYDVHRLGNGNTLVADQNGVHEYETTQKKAIWSLQIRHISRISRF
jgi:hypothetical protein